MSDCSHSASEVSPSPRSAERLIQLIPHVTRQWEERFHASHPASEEPVAPALRSALPELIARIATALEAPEEAPTPESALSLHPKSISLDQVLEELHLLRAVLFEALEAGGALLPSERDAIYTVLEHEVRHAAQVSAETHQEALRSKDALHRLLVENARDYAMLTTDCDNCITSWNTGAERLMQFREEEILGQDARLIFIPEDRAKHAPEKELAKARETGEAVNERWHLRKDGSRFWGSGIMHALYDPAGQHVGFGKVMRDRTPEKRAEEERTRFLERLGMLADITSDLLFQERPITFVQHVYSRLARSLDLEVYTNYLVDETGTELHLTAYTGLPEAVAKEIHCLSFGMAVCGSVARDRQRMILENVQSSLDPRTALVRSLGIRAYTCHPLIAGEELIGTLSFGTSCRDTFEPEEVELIRTVCEQVAVALERSRLMRALQDRAAALADADRRKDEFLAMLAHELRNPLAGIVNAVHVLDRIDAEPSPRQRLRDIVNRQAGNLTRMVDDLLDVSRITQGKIELRREVLDLGAIAQQAIDSIRPLIEIRGHTLTVKQSERPACVEADRTRLEQIVTNLLNNALRYTPPGGQIWLTVASEQGIAGEMAVLRVRDTGVGISAELLPRVFDLFTQANRTPERAEGGLGIGLTLVRRLVEMHGGSVEAVSEGPGRGSEFIVYLPLAKGTTPSAPAEPPPPKEPAEHRILVVEDNVDAAETLSELLQLWGHEVEVAHSGPAGLEAARAYQPSVVLLDIGLSGMNGFEVARQIRSDRSLRQPVLIALTGYGRDSDREQAREVGFDHHITKPVDPDVLQDLLAASPRGS